MTDETKGDVTEPTLWKKSGWIAKVIKNDSDDGWAVAMTRIGDEEPSLVGPWTMGRDKRNPKPLDQPAFMTLVKTANEILLRHEQSARARLHKTLSFDYDTLSTTGAPLRLRVDLDIAPDDDDPHAILAVFEETTGEPLRSGRVSAGFKLNAAGVTRWLKTGEG